MTIRSGINVVNVHTGRYDLNVFEPISSIRDQRSNDNNVLNGTNDSNAVSSGYLE